PHPCLNSRVTICQRQRLVHIRRHRNRVEHLHRAPHSISKINPKRISLSRVLHHVQISLHQLQHSCFGEGLFHCAHNRHPARALLRSFTSSHCNQVHQSQHFHLFRGILRQHRFRRSHIDHRPESPVDQLHQVFAPPQAPQLSADLALHHLEPF